jgi:hypothetical protein
MTSGRPKYPDDPGRDPEGLDPPRDILDAPGGVSHEGTFEPGRHTKPTHAEEPPDEPPTSTGTGGP